MNAARAHYDLIFGLMCEIEPMLRGLVSQADKHKHLSYRDKEHFWYHNLKKQMMALVGFGAKNKSLASTDCYEVAYHHLIEILHI